MYAREKEKGRKGKREIRRKEEVQLGMVGV
jgi:hypothetical protein